MFSMIKALDKAQLEGTSGQGLEIYIVDQAVDCAASPMLVLVCDEGPKNLKMIFFFLNELGMRVAFRRDICHRLDNDFFLACDDAGLHTFIEKVTLALQLNDGPFLESRYFRRQVEGLEMYISQHGPSCAILDMFVGRILEDHGKASQGAEEDRAWAWQKVLGCLGKKRGNVEKKRWWSVYNRLASLVRDWHSRVVILIYLLLLAGKDATQYPTDPDQATLTLKETRAKVGDKNQKDKDTLL